MEPNQAASTVTGVNNGIVRFSVHRLSSIPFLLGILLFLAPFIDIRCNNVSLQQVSGINLATGFEVRANKDNSLFDNLTVKDDDLSFKKAGKREANIYAFAALLMGILGFIFSLLKFKNREISGVITGIVAGAALIGLMVDIKSQLKLDLSARTDFADISLVIAFTPWFYLAIIAFLIGAILNFKTIKGKIVKQNY